MPDQSRKDVNQSDDNAYEAPRVELLGSLKRLTKGPDTGVSDGAFGNIGGFDIPVDPS